MGEIICKVYVLQLNQVLMRQKSKQEAICLAFNQAVNSLKARETPKQEQICIKKHKNVKLQDTHTLAKGSQKRVQSILCNRQKIAYSRSQSSRGLTIATRTKRTARQTLTPGLRSE